MGFSVQELLILKSALRFYDEQLACCDDIDSIVSKLDFWLAVESYGVNVESDEEFFKNLSNVF